MIHMARRRGLVAYTSWVDGVNDTAPPDSMLDTELRECRNWFTHQRGGLRTRPGCGKHNKVSYAGEVTQEFEWRLSDGSVKHIAIINKKLCLIDDTNDGAIDEKITLNADYVPFVPYQDRLYFPDTKKYYVWGDFDYYTVDGMGDPQTVDIEVGDIVKNSPASSGGGEADHFYKAKDAISSAALSTQNYGDTSKWEDITDGIIPDSIREVTPEDDPSCDLAHIKRCKYMIYHPSSMMFFAAGDDKDPQALYFSEAANPHFFKKLSKLYPTTGAGKITALVNFDRSVAVSYLYDWFAFDGTFIGEDTKWFRIALPTGAVSQRAVVHTPDSITYVAKDGIWIVDPGILNSQNVVRNMENTLYVNICDEKLENWVKKVVHHDSIVACYHDSAIWIAYGDDSENEKNNMVMRISWNRKAPVFIDGWQVNDWCPRLNNDLCFASKNYILKYGDGWNDIDVETGEEKSIKYYAKTKPYNPGSPADAFMKKLIHTLFLSAMQIGGGLNAEIKVQMRSDYVYNDIETDLAESFIWGRKWGKVWGVTEFVTQQAEVNWETYRMELIIEADRLDTSILLYSIGFDCEFIDTFKATIIDVPVDVGDYSEE